MDSKLQESFDKWEASFEALRRYLLDTASGISEPATASSDTAGCVTEPATASSGTSELVTASVGLAEPPATVPIMEESMVVAPPAHTVLVNNTSVAPATYSTECPRRDATKSTPASTPAAAPTSPTATVDIIPVLTTTAASDGALDRDATMCLMHAPSRPPDALDCTGGMFPLRQPLLPAPIPKPPWQQPGHEPVCAYLSCELQKPTGAIHTIPFGSLCIVTSITMQKIVGSSELNVFLSSTAPNFSMADQLDGGPVATYLNSNAVCSSFWCKVTQRTAARVSYLMRYCGGHLHFLERVCEISILSQLPPWPSEKLTSLDYPNFAARECLLATPCVKNIATSLPTRGSLQLHFRPKLLSLMECNQEGDITGAVHELNLWANWLPYLLDRIELSCGCDEMIFCMQARPGMHGLELSNCAYGVERLLSCVPMFAPEGVNCFQDPFVYSQMARWLYDSQFDMFGLVQLVTETSSHGTTKHNQPVYAGTLDCFLEISSFAVLGCVGLLLSWTQAMVKYLHCSFSIPGWFSAECAVFAVSEHFHWAMAQLYTSPILHWKISWLFDLKYSKGELVTSNDSFVHCLCTWALDMNQRCKHLGAHVQYIAYVHPNSHLSKLKLVLLALMRTSENARCAWECELVVTTFADIVMSRIVCRTSDNYLIHDKGLARYICSTCALTSMKKNPLEVWFTCVLPMCIAIRMERSRGSGELIQTSYLLGECFPNMYGTDISSISRHSQISKAGLPVVTTIICWVPVAIDGEANQHGSSLWDPGGCTLALRSCERWWTALEPILLHHSYQLRWISLLFAYASRIWLVTWAENDLEFSAGYSYGQVHSQGGRNVKDQAAFSNQDHVGHDYYIAYINEISVGYGNYLGQVYEDNRNDSNKMKEVNAPWDPGKSTLRYPSKASAWGQAVFQGGRDVRNPLHANTGRRYGPWPSHHRVRLQDCRLQIYMRRKR